ncbi:protein of unknown function [Bartonella clarridgeiae 73]|uniref:Uncharacterized protein n=1 Tax=Bartonella clarridgeiae (strain CCUG 45776 / CIP 104772 / 73) TaxID=696125 RepID=E6YIK3_BARC7|nr:protein of unknown function [Bartonella clarridgeiae 73]
MCVLVSSSLKLITGLKAVGNNFKL